MFLSRYRRSQSGFGAIGECSRIALCCALVVLLLIMSACSTGITHDNNPTDEAEGTSVLSQGQYMVNVRNATDQNRLSNTVVNLFIRSGYSYGEGFDYDTGRAYDQDYPMEIRASVIVIPEERADLREIAQGMREVIGVGIIIESTSSVNSWRYTGDILVVLAADCLESSRNWVLWTSDYEDYSGAQHVKYWVSIRNATTQNLLADSTMRQLNAAGFSYAEGYSYTLGNAYLGDNPLRLAETTIVIKENRSDLRKIAEELKEELGFGTIVEENSGYRWSYDGDILILLGSDSQS
ncbi:MAG: LytR C-terminal domain-containing protein [Coriobacteriia bacterium]|nr:LytR C-terminal domain-containing protein [Coriobacteriia bacterium]MCL2749398.1 LytR C-terminal domain-containing protein [Coriobacteriia bacterium]